MAATVKDRQVDRLQKQAPRILNPSHDIGVKEALGNGLRL